MVEMQIGAATMKKSMGVPKEVRNRITIWTSNPTSGCISKGIEI